MNATACDRVRDQLSAHLDGELDDAERREVLTHLEGCAACREELAELRDLVGVLRALPRVPAPPELSARVRTAIARDGETSNVVRVLRWAFPDTQGQRMLAAASLVGLASLIGLGVALYGPSGPPRAAAPAASVSKFSASEAPARVGDAPDSGAKLSEARPEAAFEQDERAKDVASGGAPPPAPPAASRPAPAEPQASPAPAVDSRSVAVDAASPTALDAEASDAKGAEASPVAKDAEASAATKGAADADAGEAGARRARENVFASPASPPAEESEARKPGSGAVHDKLAKQDARPAEKRRGAEPESAEGMAVVDGLGDERLQASGEPLGGATGRLDGSPSAQPAPGTLGGVAEDAAAKREEGTASERRLAPSKEQRDAGELSRQEREEQAKVAQAEADDRAARAQMYGSEESKLEGKKAKAGAEPASFLELMSRPGGLLYRIDTQTGQFFRDGGLVDGIKDPSVFASLHLLAASDGASPLLRMVLPAEAWSGRIAAPGEEPSGAVAEGFSRGPMPSVAYRIEVKGCRYDAATPGEPGSDEKPVAVAGSILPPVLHDGQTPIVSSALQGTSATFDIVVLRDGRVGNVAAVDAPDLPADLRPEVRRAMLRWRFTPATCNGEPVATVFRMELTWRRGGSAAP